ncbi:MAG TPA: Holliday junction branch migration protein RuvA [Bacteroidaceae bacterium]|nr:Holliday junction branch migration protein RuvA [Bacteroidaceae bacterium]
MIEFIQGKIDELSPTQVIIETTGGVGYALNISLYTYSAIQEKTDVKLYVYEAIRGDAYVLYGFSDKQERKLFLNLISVSGIGGASARMIQSAFSPSELINIISTANDKQLKMVKGIGSKTAQRIIVDLHDKITSSKSEFSNIGSPSVNLPGNIIDQASSALTMLGFQLSTSQKVVKKIVQEQPDISIEAAIKEALKRL